MANGEFSSVHQAPSTNYACNMAFYFYAEPTGVFTNNSTTLRDSTYTMLDTTIVYKAAAASAVTSNVGGTLSNSSWCAQPPIGDSAWSGMGYTLKYSRGLFSWDVTNGFKFK